MKQFYTLCATLFGLGNVLKAPGTVGSFVAVVSLYLANLAAMPTYILPIVVVGGFFFGVHCSTVAEETYGHDNGCIIIDEYIGQLLVFILLPTIAIWQYIAGFILFRFFDILKPLGIKQLQSIPKGWGVMVDDIIAAIYALVLLHGLDWLNTNHLGWF